MEEVPRFWTAEVAFMGLSELGGRKKASANFLTGAVKRLRGMKMFGDFFRLGEECQSGDLSQGNGVDNANLRSWRPVFPMAVSSLMRESLARQGKGRTVPGAAKDGGGETAK